MKRGAVEIRYQLVADQGAGRRFSKTEETSRGRWDYLAGGQIEVACVKVEGRFLIGQTV